MNKLRLVVIDVDGCLTPGEGQPWNFEALEYVAQLNRRAQEDPTELAVTLCTGRQEPYVEVLMQAIDAHLPGIYENGGGLYFPRDYCFVENPLITPAMRQALAGIKATLQREIVEVGLGYFQPGKEVSLTLYPLDKVSVHELYKAIAEALAIYRAGYIAQESVSCVDVIPRGIDKGAGVRWLSRETGIPLNQIGGIGDSASDLKFLSILGRSAAPANAADEVKVAVDYISSYEDGDGVVDILRRWVEQSLTLND
jgi:HAD superfamily hydrolase (TIGR01484 family)